MRLKLKPAVIHFVFSLAVFLIPLGLITAYWFPQPYFWNSGGWQGLRIIAIIQLILGPVLVLIVSSKVKSRKAMIFDVSLITTLQITALILGTLTIYSQRPVAVVYYSGFFEAKIEEDYAEQEFSTDELSSFSSISPPLIYVTSPDTEEEMAASLTWGLVKRKPESSLFFLYDPLEKHISEVFQENQGNLETITKNTNMKKALEAIVQQYNTELANITAVEFLGQYGNSWLIISRQGKLLGSISKS
jgi:hypothetical protein